MLKSGVGSAKIVFAKYVFYFASISPGTTGRTGKLQQSLDTPACSKYDLLTHGLTNYHWKFETDLQQKQHLWEEVKNCIFSLLVNLAARQTAFMVRFLSKWIHVLAKIVFFLKLSSWVWSTKLILKNIVFDPTLYLTVQESKVTAEAWNYSQCDPFNSQAK